MVQGTASSVGKSLMVAALCRIFRQDGYRVAPFKAQNMSLNSFVTPEGGEIGRAQAVQAEAADILPSIHMNPVLLKPESNHHSQVVVLGKVAGNLGATEYYRHTSELLRVVKSSLDRLRREYEVVVIEGAGSPAEVNLRRDEIVNMRVARMAAAPVLLVGDIDKGGVFASLLGTLLLLTPFERSLVKGLVINKFRGDVGLLRPGLEILEKRARKPVLGVVPFLEDLGIAQEDSVYLEQLPQKSAPEGCIDVAVIKLPHLSNYDDFDALEKAGCHVRYVSSAERLARPDLIIIPGSKTTMSDLAYLRNAGLDSRIVELNRLGTPVIGICGGYQMLGRVICDPEGIEGGGEAQGLGLLRADTVFEGRKRTVQVRAHVSSATGILSKAGGAEVRGYEIHMGRTTGEDAPAFEVYHANEGMSGYPDGMISASGTVIGTYIHGLFDSPAFTLSLLAALRHDGHVRCGVPISQGTWSREADYDRLALAVRQSLDMDRVYRILLDGARTGRGKKERSNEWVH